VCLDPGSNEAREAVFDVERELADLFPRMPIDLRVTFAAVNVALEARPDATALLYQRA